MVFEMLRVHPPGACVFQMSVFSGNSARCSTATCSMTDLMSALRSGIGLLMCGPAEIRMMSGSKCFTKCVQLPPLLSTPRLRPTRVSELAKITWGPHKSRGSVYWNITWYSFALDEAEDVWECVLALAEAQGRVRVCDGYSRMSTCVPQVSYFLLRVCIRVR